MINSDNSTPHPAAIYDIQVRKTIPYYDNFHDETINLLKAMNVAPKNWLDTGCGTGTLVQKAIKHFPDTKFFLVDPSPQMLDIAKRKLEGPSSKKMTFLEPSSTQNLSMQNEAFNIITAIQSHHYSTKPERAKATKVCFDLLTPKGVYITFENIQPSRPESTAIAKEYWKQFQIASDRKVSAVEEHMKRFGVEYHPITVKEHLSLLKKTGFSTMEMFWYSYMQAGFYCIK